MTRRRPRHMPTPRIWNIEMVAARLNRGVDWFRRREPRLYKQGFPRIDTLLDGWDGEAIELWLDRRSGITDAATDEELDRRLEAFGNGELEGAPSG